MPAERLPDLPDVDLSMLVKVDMPDRIVFTTVEAEEAPYRPRCRSTDGSIAGVVTARKRHRCLTHFSGVETHYIEPGDQYYVSALPPDNPDICNAKWLHHRTCLDCCPIEYDSRFRPAVPTGDDA